MYSLTMPFVDPMFHCTRLQHTLLHHTIPFYTSFIFVYITTAPSSRHSSLHHLTSGCNRDLLAMSYSDIIVLHYTSPCCIVLMLSRYLLQSWPTTTSSNVLLHVITNVELYCTMLGHTLIREILVHLNVPACCISLDPLYYYDYCTRSC